MPKESSTPKRRTAKNLPPDKLYDILCKIYPEKLAALYYEHLMGYQPPQRKEDNTKLNILPED